MEAEALEALERSDSLEDSWQLSSQGTVEEVVEVLKEVQERKSLYRSRVSEHADREIEPQRWNIWEQLTWSLQSISFPM